MKMNKYIKQILISVFCLALLTGLVAGTCEPAPPTPVVTQAAPGAIALVDSIWSSGNLVFRDKSNNAIFTIDGTNRALVVASAAALNFTTGSVAYTQEANRTSAQEAQIISDETGTGSVVFGTSPTITTPVITTINPSGTAIVTLPTATTTLVGRDTTDTLTNKTIATLTSSGTAIITFPTATATLVGKDTTDILTNKTWNGASVGFLYMQLTRGDTFVPVGSTTYTITHGLGTTPNQILLTWQSNPGVTLSTAWVSLKGATTFQVNIPATEAGAPSTIGWLAIP